MHRMSRDEVTITPYRDGPLLVRGPVRMTDQDGNDIVVDRDTVALCRCGKSRLRPFCDGTHKLVRFTAPSGVEARGGAAPAGSNGSNGSNGSAG
jgi:CDGSH-type Zn-finger protein